VAGLGLGIYLSIYLSILLLEVSETLLRDYFLVFIFGFPKHLSQDMH